MKFQISGKQLDVGDALQTHVKDGLNDVMEKYAQRPVDAHVIFSRDAHEFVCEATVHLATGLTSQAKAKETEIYAAFEACREKLDKQLRRYKRRLKDHHTKRAEPVEAFGGSSYVIAAEAETDDQEEPNSLQPVIIAEMETRIPSISVGEAVMQMELVGAPILVFRNEGTSGVNVVYRRDDGNIGWIDPGNTA